MIQTGENCLSYFISSRETAFEMSMLTKLDADILIGVMSYKQSADIYNYIHGYDKRLYSWL